MADSASQKSARNKPEPTKPFKVCFVNKREIGRSYVQVGKPLNTVVPLTPKFHTTRSPVSSENLENVMKTLEILDLHEKHEYPITTNQCYGSYKLATETDGRFSFGKRMGQMVKENLMNFEKIREY